MEKNLTGAKSKGPEKVGPSSPFLAAKDDEMAVIVVEDDEESPLIGMGECRICQDEDSISNLESPCACSGSLKYAHRKCVQHWCNEKGDITCEICHKQYQPGYTAPPSPPPDEAIIDIGRGVWQISGAPLDMHDPRLLAIAEAERHFFEAEYDEYNGANNSGAAFCRSAAMILMALLLLRHALSITDDGTSKREIAMAEVQRRPGRPMPPAARGPPPPPPSAKPGDSRVAPVDREKTCPLLLRVFTKVGGHHTDGEFAVRGKEPKDEVQIYTWMDATLRELTDLVKEVAPEARRRDANLSFAFVYPDKRGRFVVREVGRTSSYPNPRRPDSGSKALAELSFQIGDYLDVAILTQ